MADKPNEWSEFKLRCLTRNERSFFICERNEYSLRTRQIMLDKSQARMAAKFRLGRVEPKTFRHFSPF
jgi:hypothetical protein